MGMMLIEMTRRQMGRLALPKRIYQCTACRAIYAHDKGYPHWALECLKLLRITKERTV